MSRSEARPPLVIGCGALAPELVALTRRSGLPEMDLTCLPATLHNRPEQIPGAVRSRIRRAREQGYDRIFVAYADCGTGGLLDRVLEAEGVERLDGAHCYEVFAGRDAFAALHDDEPGTFYLTDFLARNFDRLVVRGLGLDRHPELLPIYFGNYRRLVYLAQTDDDGLTTAARRGARRLGLAFERRFTGLGQLGAPLRSFAAPMTTITAPQARFDAELPVNGPRRAARAVSVPGRHDRGPNRSSAAPDLPFDRDLVPGRHESTSRRAISSRGRAFGPGILPGRKAGPLGAPTTPRNRGRRGARATVRAVGTAA